jgi:hypothetical protein
VRDTWNELRESKPEFVDHLIIEKANLSEIHDFADKDIKIIKSR